MTTFDRTKDSQGRRPSRRDFVRLTAVGAATLGGGLLAACGGGGGADPEAELRAGRGTKNRMDAPAVQWDGATQCSINIKLTAGATGAAAGFSLQWMTLADFEANGGWRDSDEAGLCKASFSGNANLSRYNLAAGESVTVTVGEFLFDNGASTNCADKLTCGTQYVFRAFAHANSSLMRSDFTTNTTCSTLACEQDAGCTYTQGYWKTHGPIPTGNNANEWPVASLVLGTVAYTDLELLAILNRPAQGNGLVSLAHQLIAAKLNAAKGTDATAIAASIAAADALIGGLVVPPSGTGSLASAQTSALTTALMNYNEGATGPGHCN